MSDSEEENKELEPHQEYLCEMGVQDEQNDDDTEARIAELISRKQEGVQLEYCNEKTDDEGADESYETEPMEGEPSCDFGSMLENVQEIVETLHSKSSDINTLLERLNGYSNVYKIENLVKEFYWNSFELGC